MFDLLNISIIYGSTREGRLGIKFAKYLHNEFNKRGNITNLIDPLDLKLDPLIKRYADFEKEGKRLQAELENKAMTLDSLMREYTKLELMWSDDMKAEKQKQINSILEKISKSGYESLTKEEKELLFKESK